MIDRRRLAPRPLRTSARFELVRTRARRALGLALLVGLVSTLLARATPAAEGPDTLWLAGSYVDYAPFGMPDFSQCRAEWSQPGSPGQWTHAGPVALADALWWLDSVAEPAPRPPSEPHDGHGLVTAYPVFGPPVDDHSAATLFALVEDLALRAGTDGRGGQVALRGTRWETLVTATEDYVKGRRLSSRYAVQHRAAPDSSWLAARLAEGAGTVLQLGVWEQQAAGWRRVGGHFAALAGGAADATSIALADPLADAAGLGGAGRAEPADAAAHSCREAPRAHDDAAQASHDLFRLLGEPALPDGRLIVDGYFEAANEHEAAAFQGQNPSSGLASVSGTWQRGPVVMALDGALAISPRGALPTVPPTVLPTATTASVTPTATETPVPTEPATATPSATASASTPEPSRTATFAPFATRTPSPRPALAGRLWLPVALQAPR